MEKTAIVNRINQKLAGEVLEYNELEIFLDSVIDEINGRINACYPAFSEFTLASFPQQYPNYNFFPEKYIRSVVIPGAAYKFYVMDEEGLDTPQAYALEYSKALFEMVRDFVNEVPREWRTDPMSSVPLNENAWYEPSYVDYKEIF